MTLTPIQKFCLARAADIEEKNITPKSSSWRRQRAIPSSFAPKGGRL